jgi:hypothetical protein
MRPECFNHYPSSSEIFKILLTLLHPPIMAGLVLGARDAMGPAATIGHRIKAHHVRRVCKRSRCH